MPTGYVFDDIFTKHNQANHPENARRLTAVMSYLTDNNILPALTLLPGRAATKEELSRCHHLRYVQLVEETSRGGGGMLVGMIWLDAMARRERAAA